MGSRCKVASNLDFFDFLGFLDFFRTTGFWTLFEVATLAALFEELVLVSSFRTAGFVTVLDANAAASRSALRRALPGFLPFVRAMLCVDVKGFVLQDDGQTVSVEEIDGIYLGIELKFQGPWNPVTPEMDCGELQQEGTTAPVDRGTNHDEGHDNRYKTPDANFHRIMHTK